MISILFKINYYSYSILISNIHFISDMILILHLSISFLIGSPDSVSNCTNVSFPFQIQDIVISISILILTNANLLYLLPLSY